MTAAKRSGPIRCPVIQPPTPLASLCPLTVGLVCCIAPVTRLGFLADLLSKPILGGVHGWLAWHHDHQARSERSSGWSFKSEFSLLGQMVELSPAERDPTCPRCVASGRCCSCLGAAALPYPPQVRLLACLLATTIVRCISTTPGVAELA